MIIDIFLDYYPLFIAIAVLLLISRVIARSKSKSVQKYKNSENRKKEWSSLGKQALAVVLLAPLTLGVKQYFDAQTDQKTERNGVDSIVQQLRLQLDSFNEQLPKRIDSSTILEAATVDDWAVVTYTLRLEDSASNYDSLEFVRQIKPKIIDSICRDSTIKFTLDNGGSFAYVYLDIGGKLVAYIPITSKDCFL